MSIRKRRLLASGGVCALLLALSAPAHAALPDNRGWEMVSPAEKNGGEVSPPGSIAAGGDLQAAAQGGAIAYSSATSFEGGSGAPPASQYLAARSGAGWRSQNLTVPIFSGSYDFVDRGVPYRLFSADLSRAVMLNGDRCRGGEAALCPVANPPLSGSGAPAGFQDFYLREGEAFRALIDEADIAGRGLDPATFEVRLAGASPDLGTVVLESCAALAPGALDGCPEAKQNLYAWSAQDGALETIGQTPGAELAAAAGAISDDGARIYWRQPQSDDLFLHEGTTNAQIDASVGGGGEFQLASSNGAVAYFVKEGHLYRYSAGTAGDIAPAGGVAGMLGASGDGNVAYFQDGAGLKRWTAGAATTIAAGTAAADPSTYPPASGAARVSEDGNRLLFLSSEKLTGYDNTDKVSGQPDTELFLYTQGTGLRCLSCNPKGKRPIGPTTIPGAYPNGTEFAAYKPRVLVAGAKRVFFTSADSLVAADSNSNPTSGAGIPDVYQWEAQGVGSCVQAAGCLALLSSGSTPQGASFVDASADGADAYFLTEASLLGSDPGSGDLYDARVGGGFPEASAPIPCEGDACQILPSVPSEPALATLAPGAGNPPVSYRKYCRRGYVKRKGICIKRGTRPKSSHRKNKGHAKQESHAKHEGASHR